jgi:hypothetical protein
MCLLPRQPKICCTDVYGRISQRASYTGKTEPYPYTGLTTIASEGIKSVTTVKNGLDQVTSMTEPS